MSTYNITNEYKTLLDEFNIMLNTLKFNTQGRDILFTKAGHIDTSSLSMVEMLYIRQIKLIAEKMFYQFALDNPTLVLKYLRCV